MATTAAPDFRLEAQAKLYAKLAKIIGEITSIPKSGHNDFHNYDYVTANDLINAVRDKLSAAGVFIFTSVERQEIKEIVDDSNPDKVKRSILTMITLKHTFCDGDGGGTFEVFSQGQGSDVSDKGGYKAITGAMKYFIYKCFMIPTDEDGSEIETTRNASARFQNQDRAPRRETPEEERAPATTKPGQLAWREVAIHFGVYKGKRLGELTPGQLKAWFNWKPNPRYKAREDDLLLAAICAAGEEVGG